MRLIGIMQERWCSSSRASCSVATPGGPSRSSCRNAIRASCSSTSRTASRAGWGRSRRPARGGCSSATRSAGGSRCGPRCATRSATSASSRSAPRPASTSRRCASTRAEADERLAAWMEAAPIEDIVGVWERQPLFADQSEALVEAQRPGRLAPGSGRAGDDSCAPPARACSSRSGTSCSSSTCRCWRSRARATRATCGRPSASPTRRRAGAPRSSRTPVTPCSCSGRMRWRGCSRSSWRRSLSRERPT